MMENNLDLIRSKIENGDLTHMDIFNLIDEIEYLRSVLEKLGRLGYDFWTIEGL